MNIMDIEELCDLREYCREWAGVAHQEQDGQHRLKNYLQKRYWKGVEDAYIRMLHHLDNQQIKEKEEDRTMEKCDICGGPPSSYPTWLIGKGHAYHLGCLTDDYELLRVEHKKLIEAAFAGGTWGPWVAGDWEGSWSQKHWGKEE